MVSLRAQRSNLVVGRKAHEPTRLLRFARNDTDYFDQYSFLFLPQIMYRIFNILLVDRFDAFHDFIAEWWQISG